MIQSASAVLSSGSWSWRARFEASSYRVTGRWSHVLDPTAVFAGRPFDWGFFALAMLLYAVHAPLQEFVVRAGLQGSVQHFLRVPPHRVDWKAIVISNLLFAAGHGLMGFWFSAASFVPGLFWGWMFAKQRSLIGVTISHIAVGWWALFALGLHAMIGGG